MRFNELCKFLSRLTRVGMEIALAVDCMTYPAKGFSSPSTRRMADPERTAPTASIAALGKRGSNSTTH